MPLISPPQASKPTTVSAAPTACGMGMMMGSGGAMIWWCHCSTHGERVVKAAGRYGGTAHLVGCCVCVCCVLCFVLQPTTRRLYLFFSGRNFFQFCNNWCSYFDTTDCYLRFISTVSQTTVPFLFRVVFFSGCNLNPPKNMASQKTVPFFSGSIFFRLYVSTIIGACVKIRTPITTQKNYDQK
jgi:hypothetical protein